MIVFPVLIPGQNFLSLGREITKCHGRVIWGLYSRESWETGIPSHPWFTHSVQLIDCAGVKVKSERLCVCVCVWVCVWVGRGGERTVFTNFFFTLILSVKTTLWARVRIAMSQSIVLLRYFLWRTIVLTFIIVSTGPWSSIYNSHKSSFPAQYWIYFWSWNKYLDHNIFCASVVAQIVITQADWKSPETKLKLICNWNKNCFHLMLRWVRLG